MSERKVRGSIILTLIVSFLSILPAQTTWMKTYQWGEGRCIQHTSDGGYIIVGEGSFEFPDTSWYPDIWLLKINANGDTMWTRFYGYNYGEFGRCVRETSEGGYIITGYVEFFDIPSQFIGELWLLKTDKDGDTIWTKVYGDFGGYNDEGRWVEQTSDGGYIITGEWQGGNILLLKTDDKGDSLWMREYDSGDTEIGYCVQETTDSGYIITGLWHADIPLIKTNPEGDTSWMQIYGSDQADRGYCVRQTSDSGYIVVGYTGPLDNLWLLKTDSQGDTLWTRTYWGGKKDAPYWVQQTSDGGYVILCNTVAYGEGNSDAWLLKTDSLGDTLWTRTYGGSGYDIAHSVEQTSDGGYIITGGTWSYGGGDWISLWLIKTDSLGEVGVEEEPSPPPTLDWEVLTSVGRTITLRYANRPQGFKAIVFDASGRKVDAISSSSQSGIITWGECYGPGVYFIKVNSPNSLTSKVVLIK